MMSAARIIGLIACLAACLVPAAAAASACSEGWICVEGEERAEGGTVDLVARNLKPWPVTVTVAVEGDNLSVSPRREVTATLQGEDTRPLMTLGAQDPDRGWRYTYRYDWAVGSIGAQHEDDYAYALPFAPDARWRILQGYGSRFSHTGLETWTIDFDMPVGSPVHAAREGIVVRVRSVHDQSCWERGCGRYANFIVVLHADRTTGEYYHLRKDGVVVEPGERVARGQLIGYSGNTGRSTMPHLHFGVYRATSWGRTESVPVSFMTAGGTVRGLKPGRRYRHP
jgi:murein DD-endopeptidase MepM/ murein hydrolase activator NlpD